MELVFCSGQIYCSWLVRKSHAILNGPSISVSTTAYQLQVSVLVT